MFGLTWVLAVAPALACGGFFCDGNAPVTQAGELIVFSQDGDEITADVTISYTGEAEAFSWVLPVPSVPELYVSSPLLTRTLVGLTTPGVSLTRFAEGYGDADADSDSDADVDTTAGGSGSGGGVVVVSEAPVGPYETAVLKANDTTALVDWLQKNGYFVPDTLDDALAVYVSPTTYFLALKLQKGKSTGDLAPLGMRFVDAHPMVPIVLTRIAAVEDMPITVFLLGHARGVPLNWYDAEINPLAWDWTRSGTRGVDDRVRRANDEAAHHAFTTLYAGVPATTSYLWSEGRYDTTALLTAPTLVDWILGLPGAGVGLNDPDVVPVLRAVVPPPVGVDETDFYNAIVQSGYYGTVTSGPYAAYLATLPYDAAAATAALDTLLIEPRHQGQLLMDANPYVTRLETVLSPDEMVDDPLFGFNAELPEVGQMRLATLDERCIGDWSLALPGGFTLAVPRGADLATWADAHVGHYGLVVRQYGETGKGTVVSDWSDELRALAGTCATAYTSGTSSSTGRDTTAVESKSGCGCDAAPGAGAVAAPLLALAALARRRVSGRSATST